MKIENTGTKTAYKKIVFSLVAAGAIALLFFALKPATHSLPLYGTYRLTIDRSNPYTRLANQDIYLEVKEDKTIAYSQTVNDRMAFHHEGQYKLNEKTNTLDIDWKTGKLPNKLVIEKQEGNFIIQVGKDIYKKESRP